MKDEEEFVVKGISDCISLHLWIINGTQQYEGNLLLFTWVGEGFLMMLLNS